MKRDQQHTYSLIPQVGLNIVECMRTLPLSREGREIVSDGPLAQE